MGVRDLRLGRVHALQCQKNSRRRPQTTAHPLTIFLRRLHVWHRWRKRHALLRLVCQRWVHVHDALPRRSIIHQ